MNEIRGTISEKIFKQYNCTSLELLRIQEIQDLAYEKFKELKFDEPTHTYTVHGVKYTSGTTVLGKYSSHFKTHEIANNIWDRVGGSKSGITPQDIINSWALAGIRGSVKGTYIHSLFEEYYQTGKLNKSVSLKKLSEMVYNQIFPKEATLVTYFNEISENLKKNKILDLTKITNLFSSSPATKKQVSEYLIKEILSQISEPITSNKISTKIEILNSPLSKNFTENFFKTMTIKEDFNLNLNKMAKELSKKHFPHETYKVKYDKQIKADIKEVVELITNDLKYNIPIVEAALKQIQEKLPHVIPIAAELRMFDEEWGVSGTADLIGWDRIKDCLVVLDFKTNKKIIEFDSEFGAKQVGVVSHLEDTNGVHYSEQLPLYGNILKKALGIDFNSSYILHVNVSESLDERVKGSLLRTLKKAQDELKLTNNPDNPVLNEAILKEEEKIKNKMKNILEENGFSLIKVDPKFNDISLSILNDFQQKYKNINNNNLNQVDKMIENLEIPLQNSLHKKIEHEIEH